LAKRPIKQNCKVTTWPPNTIDNYSPAIAFGFLEVPPMVTTRVSVQFETSGETIKLKAKACQYCLTAAAAPSQKESEGAVDV
jgi:hypothetical protein